jgi:RNA polymerase sigma-70 factor (ECF subfamily)
MSENASKSNQLENEREIVERAKTDEQAFEILYNHYFSRIYAFVFKRTGHHEITEDIVSLTFMKVFTNIKKYQHQGYSFGAWVYRIANNNLIDHYRKAGRKKEVDIEAIAEPKSQEGGPEFEAGRAQDRIFVHSILKKMSTKDQEVLHLKFFAELSNVEIAQTLNISANNAGVIIHRALKKFDQLYKKYGKE